jgi:hypothetical protein
MPENAGLEGQQMGIHSGVVQGIALIAFLAALVLVSLVRKALLAYVLFLAYLAAAGAAGFYVAEHFWGFDARGWGVIVAVIIAFVAFYRFAPGLLFRAKSIKPEVPLP